MKHDINFCLNCFIYFSAAVCVGVPLRQKADDDMERTQVIILAVVCAVFGALILFGIIYICRKRCVIIALPFHQIPI